MGAQTLSLIPHFKSTVIKQQTISGTSAAFTALTIADITAASPPINANNGIIPRPDNIYVYALPGNSGTITIMQAATATSLGAGFILSAGQGVSLPLQDISKYSVIASAASQIFNTHYQYGEQ